MSWVTKRMGSKEVEIVGVDYGTECLCLSRTKDKKIVAPTTGTLLGASEENRRISCAYAEDCIIIDDTPTGLHNQKRDFIEIDSIDVDRTFQSHREEAGKKHSTSIPSSKGHQTLSPSHSMPSTTPYNHSEQHSQSPIGVNTATQQGYNCNDSPKLKVDGPVDRNSPSSSVIPGNSHFDLSPVYSAECSGLLQEQEEQALSSLVKDQTFPSIAPFQSPVPVTDIHRIPKCWTVCPNCPPDAQRKFHLIDVTANSAEWTFVSSQLQKSGFTVNRIRRIQNESLWQRLCYEKQLMFREKKDVNEQLLYHTSRSSVEIISEEGLDLRLSTNGNFGSGIYFSDNPVKCNSYWRGYSSNQRYMFCCRVLLGDIKVYPKGKAERLKREPRKEHWKPGDQNKYYDSVMGNLSGQNEFVVYNMYRVMPEYVLYYEALEPEPWPNLSTPLPPFPSLQLPDPRNAMLHQMLKSKKRKRKRH